MALVILTAAVPGTRTRFVRRCAPLGRKFERLAQKRGNSEEVGRELRRCQVLLADLRIEERSATEHLRLAFQSHESSPWAENRWILLGRRQGCWRSADASGSPTTVERWQSFSSPMTS